jgi:hypothetical protein
MNTRHASSSAVQRVRQIDGPCETVRQWLPPAPYAALGSFFPSLTIALRVALVHVPVGQADVYATVHWYCERMYADMQSASISAV